MLPSNFADFMTLLYSHCYFSAFHGRISTNEGKFNVLLSSNWHFLLHGLNSVLRITYIWLYAIYSIYFSRTANRAACAHLFTSREVQPVFYFWHLTSYIIAAGGTVYCSGPSRQRMLREGGLLFIQLSIQIFVILFNCCTVNQKWYLPSQTSIRGHRNPTILPLAWLRW